MMRFQLNKLCNLYQIIDKGKFKLKNNINNSFKRKLNQNKMKNKIRKNKKEILNKKNRFQIRKKRIKMKKK